MRVEDMVGAVIGLVVVVGGFVLAPQVLWNAPVDDACEAIADGDWDALGEVNYDHLKSVSDYPSVTVVPRLLESVETAGESPRALNDFERTLREAWSFCSDRHGQDMPIRGGDEYQSIVAGAVDE